MSRRSRRFLVLVGTAILVLSQLGGATAIAASSTKPSSPSQKAVFFAADGLRQDAVKRYVNQGLLKTMGRFLRNGTYASGNGLRTQAPPNTGAGWYTLATGAWPGVHASTNNTFHISGQPFANRTAAFDANVLQVETIAQSAERAGLKVAQVEWAGGRNATIAGPTIDFRSFHSGRGVSTNFIGTSTDELFDDVPFITSFGLQFDTPAGHAGQAPFPDAEPKPADGWTDVPTSHSPAMQMRLRVLDFGVDKYGLNAYIFDRTDNGRVDYDRVLFSPTKDGDDSVGTLRKGQWADVKVKIIGGALEGKTAGMLVRVEELTKDLSRVRLFHTSVSRAIATWPTWPGEPGFTGAFDEYLAQTFPTSTAADFAVLEAGIVSEQTYVDQGLYWSTGHTPMLKYVVRTYKPDLLMAGMPTTDEFQHQFLGPGHQDPAERRPQPGVRRRQPRRHQGPPGQPALEVHPAGVRRGRCHARPGPQVDRQGPDDIRRLGPRVRPAVPRHRRQQAARGSRPPLEAADLQLPAGDRRDHRQGQGLLGRRRRPDLPQPRRSGSRRGWIHPGPGGRPRRDRGDDQGGLPRHRRSERLDPRRRSLKAGR